MTEKPKPRCILNSKGWGILGNSMGWVQLIIINGIISILLTLVSSTSLYKNFVFSQFIGFSIVLMLTFLIRMRKPTIPSAFIYIVGIPAGSVIGIVISLIVTGSYQDYGGDAGTERAVRGLLFSIVIGSSLAWYFLQRSYHLQERAELAEQREKNATKERRLAQAQLVVLQAQIEPHFLFNTLSNVVGLIDTDSASAKKMLESLTTYLRATLDITRQAKTTVQHEVDLLEAYLSIFKIRMGGRLQYELSVQSDCRQLPLPPLLLQPLIENAIKHGLEPQLDGGKIDVTIKQQDDFLICQVADTGQGLHGTDDSAIETGDNGLGLSNVRERLFSLYGSQAQLSIIENTRGVTAMIQIPLSEIS